MFGEYEVSMDDLKREARLAEKAGFDLASKHFDGERRWALRSPAPTTQGD